MFAQPDSSRVCSCWEFSQHDDDDDDDDDIDDDDDSDDTDDDDDDDDDNVTLARPETQKSPSMAWKNFMLFTTHTVPLTYHLTFCIHSFSFFFLSLKLKWELHELFEREI